MKIRNGFVSNSSSSSFLINIKDVTPFQLELIKDHINAAEKYGVLRFKDVDWQDDAWEAYDENDAWRITVGETGVKGVTYMDNFSMSTFLKNIGIPESAVTWSDYDEWDL